jgi:hypothetical protein
MTKEKSSKEDKPEAGKVYALTGGPGARCISNGFSWKDSVVDEQELQTQSSLEKRQMIYLALLFLMPSTIAVLAGLMILSLVGLW